MTNKSWFGKLFRRKSITVTSPFWMFTSDGGKVLISDDKAKYLHEGFGANSTVYSIIKHISDKFATLPFYLYEITDKKEFNRYKSLSSGLSSNSSLIEYERSRKKSLREVDKHPFLEAFDKLGFEGKAQLCGYRDISGDAFLWKNKGLGKEPLSYKILPSQFMNIDANDTLDGVNGYRLNIGKGIPFEVDEIAHWKHWNPFYDTTGSHLYGLSPLRAGFLDLLTSRAGKEAAYRDFKNNGVRGVVTRNEDIPWSEEIRDAANDWADENLNGVDNRSKIRVLNMKTNWMQMGMSSSEMELLKALQLTKEDLCNVYSFPMRLLAGVEGTFNNVDASGKQLITNCVYPRAVSFRDFVNNQLLPDFDKSSNLFYDVDITALPELQDEMKLLYDLMVAAWWVSPEEKREMTNWDASNEPLMKKFYIPSTVTPIDQANQDLGADITNSVNAVNAAGAKDYKD